MPYGTGGKYSVVFCGPGGCEDPGPENSTFITKDPNYQVISENTIQTRGSDDWSTYHKCTQETHPVLKYKEPADTSAPLQRGIATETENKVTTGDKPSGAGQTSPARDWKVVRSVPDGAGGTNYFVLIPETKQRNPEYYDVIGDALCEAKAQCSANFWTDPTRIPQSAWMPVPDLAVMTASYERRPSYAKPQVHLACWLYPTKAIGESMQCEYSPGAKVPPEK
jgi:hypothetical protein